MRLLMLGGTKFLGRALVDEALARGDEVTIFTRGLTNPSAYGDEVRHLVGDRTSDLSALRGGSWDAVVDTCGYDPEVVERSASMLSGAVGHYTFISSVSVYPDWHRTLVDESSPLRGPEQIADDDGYGYRKRRCEEAVDRHFPGRAVMVRAGLIVGPHEDVGRLPYWLYAAQRGTTLVAPGPPDRLLQLIDARDIAGFALLLAQDGAAGAFNVTAPEGDQSFRDLVVSCLTATDSDAETIWVDDDVLASAGIEPWTELPLWLPREGDGWVTDTTRAQAAGLVCRPLEETVADTWAWLRELDGYQPRWPWVTEDKLDAVRGSSSLR